MGQEGGSVGPGSGGTDGAPGTVYLPGGGRMAALILAKAWDALPVGPMATWPASLKAALSICLGSRHPMFIWWRTGDALTIFYNDAYIPVAGSKHPAQLGASPRDAAGWAEIWPEVAPLVEQVLERGEATWNEDLRLVLRRSGYAEETYFTFSYSPIAGERGDISGVFCACSDTTQQVLNRRRFATLRGLTAGAALVTAEDVVQHAAAELGGNLQDVPFALIYLLDDHASHLRLAGASGPGRVGMACPEAIGLPAADPWPVSAVLASGRAQRVTGLRARWDGHLGAVDGGVGADEAVVLPLEVGEHGCRAGVLVVGISPWRAYDRDYAGFVALIGGHIATSLRRARALQAERRRAAQLVEADRVRTTLLANVAESERRLTRLLETLPVPFYIADDAWVITYVNPSARPLFGAAGAHAMGRVLWDLLPGLRESPFGAAFERAKRGHSRTSFEGHYALFDRWYFCWVYPIAEGTAVVVTDVTEQVLARRRAERLADELREAVEARDDFLSIASHELKTPITSLKMQLQMTRRGVRPAQGVAPDATKLARVLDLANRQVDRLSVLIEDLLDVARIESGKMTCHFEPVDLAALAGEVTERFAEQARASGVAITVAASRAVIATCDRFRIEQVVTNLLSNAIKYGAGSPVHVAVDAAAAEARVSVADRGLGIAADHQARVFARFERAVSHRHISGLGLGLFIAKQIVEAHRGRISVDSALGEGSVFTFVLPREPATAPC